RPVSVMPWSGGRRKWGGKTPGCTSGRARGGGGGARGAPRSGGSRRGRGGPGGGGRGGGCAGAGGRRGGRAGGGGPAAGGGGGGGGGETEAGYESRVTPSNLQVDLRLAWDAAGPRDLGVALSGVAPATGLAGLPWGALDRLRYGPPGLEYAAVWRTSAERVSE